MAQRAYIQLGRLIFNLLSFHWLLGIKFLLTPMSQLKTLSQRGKAHKQQRALTNAEYFDGLFHRSNSSRTSNVVVNHSHGELDIVHQDFSVAAKNGFDTQFADRINSRPKPQYDITGKLLS